MASPRVAAESHRAVTKVNVGCGPKHQLPGWCNVDLRPFPGVDEVMDATQQWPFQGLRFVYGEHFLEHLAIDEAITFLVHAGNALTPGGKLRLSTPNLEWVVHTHFRPGPAERPQRLRDTIRLNRAFYGWGHRFLWSDDMLREVLERIGYGEVRFFAYGESDDAELRDVERHGKYSVADGYPSVLIVEATRGQRTIAADPELLEWLEQELLSHVRSGH